MRYFALFLVLWAVSNPTPTLAADETDAPTVWDAVPVIESPVDTLTIADALARVRRGHAVLLALPHRLAEASGRIEQAGARLNPHATFTAENVEGSYPGLDQSEFSLWLSQSFEFGGKRALRQERAKREAAEVGRETRVDAFDVYLETRARFAAVVFAEERLTQARAAQAVVVELAAAAEERARVGATLTSDAALARAAVVVARMAIRDAETERTRARVALAALWGDPSGFDEPVSPAPFEVVALPPDSAAAWAARSPAVVRLRLAQASRRAEAALERSLRVPDVTLDAGVRRVEADDAVTVLVGVGFPLPLWDRRAGAIRSSDARVRVADFELAQARANIAAELAQRLNEHRRLRERWRQIETDLLPAVETALGNMRTAYAIGRVSYPDLLEVQRSLITFRNDANETRLGMVEETLAIERLAGRTIGKLVGDE